MTDITELAQTEINDALAQLKQLSEYPTPSTQYARVLRKYITSLVEALEKTNGELVGYIDADYADMLKDGDIDKCYLHKECSEGAVPLYLGVELKNG